MQDQNSTTVAAQPVDDPFDDEALSELRDVRDRLLPLDVLEGLSPEHQFTLVDRVWLCDDSDRRYEGPDGTKKHIKIMTAFQKQTPRDRKRLTRKLNRARDAWKAFLQEIDSVHERGKAIHLAHSPCCGGGAWSYQGWISDRRLSEGVPMPQSGPRNASDHDGLSERRHGIASG